MSASSSSSSRLLHLVNLSRQWASGRGFDHYSAQKLREELILSNHRYYFENVPVYRALVQEAGSGEECSLTDIKKKFMLSADIFKSYEQDWLDANDFNRMNKWLSGLYTKRIEPDAGNIRSIDDWIDLLSNEGISVIYSSGTSGAFSFVPKSAQDRESVSAANIAYLAPLFIDRLGGSSISRHLVKNAVGMVSPETLSRFTGKKVLKGFDAAFLGFRKGRTANQALIQQLAPLFDNHYFLYSIEISGNALRCLRRGARTEGEKIMLESLRNEVAGKRDENYAGFINNIEKSVRAKKKVFVFGAPYQFKELCEIMSALNRKISLRKGSLALFGGGWKTFAGEMLDRDSLVKAIADTFTLGYDSVMEGYSMSEISTLLIRCREGRFHIPPHLEPAAFDKELNPLAGDDVTGSFGFLDPLASSYPGFIITNDYVRITNGECACGLSGPAVLSISRLPGTEVKGCGGIMSSISV